MRLGWRDREMDVGWRDRARLKGGSRMEEGDGWRDFSRDLWIEFQVV